MEILFTGASSLTGMWMVRDLALQGHHVTAIFQKPQNSYEGMRKQRIEKVLPFCTAHFGISFGDHNFFDLLEKQQKWDLLCHHGADATHYKSPNFDVDNALHHNTRNLNKTLSLLSSKGCKAMVITGSVFEEKEGISRDSSRAFSPYGISKGLTADTCLHLCTHHKMRLGKFVIANPFGPYEDEKFTTYLAKEWLKNHIPVIQTPDYIRDNIPVTLLSQAYVHFVHNLSTNPGYEKFSPSGYQGSQKDFTGLFSERMQIHLNIPCKYQIAQQRDFQEPLERLNDNILNWHDLQWNEQAFWEELASFYRSL